MGQPSWEASNAIVYVTYGVFLYVSNDSSLLCHRYHAEYRQIYHLVPFQIVIDG